MTAKQMEQGQPETRKPDLRGHYGTIGIEAIAAATLFKTPSSRKLPARMLERDLD